MAEINTNSMISVQQDREVTPVDVIYSSDYNRENYERRLDQFYDMIYTFVMIDKNNAAIAKKEADTCTFTAKAHIDMEQAYIKSLLRDKYREDITPEEQSELNDRIEAAQIRMKAQNRESRRQAEKSPYRKAFDWKKVLLCLTLMGGGFALHWGFQKRVA